jgi:hypothetical protein
LCCVVVDEACAGHCIVLCPPLSSQCPHHLTSDLMTALDIQLLLHSRLTGLAYHCR